MIKNTVKMRMTVRISIKDLPNKDLPKSKPVVLLYVGRKVAMNPYYTGTVGEIPEKYLNLLALSSWAQSNAPEQKLFIKTEDININNISKH